MGFFRVNKLAAAAALGLAVLASPVVAGVTYFAPLTTFEDDDRDRWIDADGNGKLSTGDQLIAPLELVNTSGVFGGGPIGFGADELTGISNITVKSVSGPDSQGEFSFVFGPTVGFMGNTVADVAAGKGAMVAFYLDPTPDLNLVGCTDTTTCEVNATNGALYFTAGFTGDSAEGWVADDVVTDNPLDLLGIAASTKVAVLNFSLGFITNNTGQSFVQQACFLCPGDKTVDIIGSGDLLGGQGLTNGYFARSDFDFQVAVPEPTSLALVALGLLGAGFAGRRRAK